MKTLVAIAVAVLFGATSCFAHEGHEHAAGPGVFGQRPEYVHVLLNPLLDYGLGMAVLVLGAALVARSKPAQTIALVLIVLTSASGWLVQYYGHNAYEHVRSMSDKTGQRWLDEHMERGEKVVYVYYATALLGLATLASRRKFPKAAARLTLASLLAGVVALGLGVWTSKAGGRIRHPEFRGNSLPPEHTEPHEHHGEGEQPHKHMQHETPSSTNSGHKREAMAEKPAVKTPLPDTLEAAWKAIHEHHAELEAAVNGKNFDEVQSHAQALGDLFKRLAELSSADEKPAIGSGVNKITQSLVALQQSAETGSETVMKNNFGEFAKSLSELEQQTKQQ